MKKLFFFFSLCFFSSLFALDTYENATVGKIDIEIMQENSVTTFDKKSLLSQLKTQEGIPFSQLIFDEDLKFLSNKFDKVQPSVSFSDEKVYIIIKLWPKPLIHKICWEGNKKIKTKTLQKELKIKEGEVFSRSQFNKALNKVKELYIKKGYFESQISYTSSPVPHKNEIDISIKIKEGRSGKIQKINFKGFTKKEQKDLLEMMYTKKFNVLLSWLSGEGIFRQEALEQDQMVILNYLQNKGYADANVDIRINDDPSSNNKLIIQIIAHRGTLYRFGKISFSGNTFFDDVEIQKRIIIYPEDVYSPEKVRETAQAIKDLYGQKGYIETQVHYDTQLMEKEPIYNIAFQIEEGDLYKIGLIRVVGNTQTKTNVILRESLLVPGEIFDSRRLKATQQRLENIGYFKNVNVYAIRATDDNSLGSNYRDVYIEVEETTTGSVSLSVGMSSMDDVFGTLDLTESNFNSKGIFSVPSEGVSALKGGGEYLHIKAMFGAKQHNYLLSWLDPYFRDSLWRLGFEASRTYQKKYQAKDYKIITTGFSLYASYPITNYWTFGTKYRLRNADIHIRKSAGEEAIEQEENSGLISAVNAYLGYDSTNSAYKAHRGIRSTFETEFAGVGGDTTFLKFSYINAIYFPLYTKGTLKGRGEIRFILPMGQTDRTEVPLNERFFLGGESTVRGYKPYILGPRYSNRDDPTGGISSTLLSLEFRHEIFSLLDVFAFIDAGSISMHRFSIPKLNASYGVGTRLEIMRRVPFLIGVGLPINPDNKKDFQYYFFSMGGQF